MAKLAISNIAWTAEEEASVAKRLQELGVTYVEVAPTKVWDNPLAATDQDIAEYAAFWESYGITVAAFQSMLFTRPDLKIFESEAAFKDAVNTLGGYIRLAGKMNASALVFGSPKNRQRGDMPVAEAEAIAIKLFDLLGTMASENETKFCIEPNPVDYACDYITNAQEGLELVKKVDNNGFKLHLDIAGMTLAGDNIAESIKKSANLLQHFHISSPLLGQVEDNDIQHRVAAQTLKEVGYEGFVSIEMRPGEQGTNIDRVTKAVTFAQDAYAAYLN